MNVRVRVFNCTFFCAFWQEKRVHKALVPQRLSSEISCRPGQVLTIGVNKYIIRRISKAFFAL